MRKLLLVAFVIGMVCVASAAPKKVVMIAGKQSHGLLSHEHNAGIQLLAKCLNEGASKQVAAIVQLNGWPTDESVFDDADAVVIYADGGGDILQFREIILRN